MLEAYSDDDLMRLVAGGAGVAIVPRSLRADDATTSTPIEGLGLRRTVYLFRVAGRPRTAAASTFRTSHTHALIRRERQSFLLFGQPLQWNAGPLISYGLQFGVGQFRPLALL